MIRQIEAHNLVAVPTLKTIDCDGWIIRIAKDRSKRANSVNFKTEGKENVLQKITFCESQYKNADQPCHFRLTPLAYPENIDDILHDQGYSILDPTDVCIRNLTDFPPRPATQNVNLDDRLPAKWLEALVRIKGLSESEKKALGETLELTGGQTCFASIQVDGKIVALGLGVLSGKIVGLFEFMTDSAYTRRGYAQAIVDAILHHANQQGVETAYIQVVQENLAGMEFWKAMDFSAPLYTYHYRTKNIQD